MIAIFILHVSILTLANNHQTKYTCSDLVIHQNILTWWWKVHEKLTKVITIQSLGTEDVWNQPHGNPSDSHWDISVGTQVVDWPTDIAIPWTVLLLWQRKTMQPNNKRHCLCLVVFFSGPCRFSSPHIDPVKSRFHTRMFTLKHCCNGSSMLFFSFSYFLLLVWQQIATFNCFFFFPTDGKPPYLCFLCCTHRAEGNVLPGISHRFLTIR